MNNNRTRINARWRKIRGGPPGHNVWIRKYNVNRDETDRYSMVMGVWSFFDGNIPPFAKSWEYVLVRYDHRTRFI